MNTRLALQRLWWKELRQLCPMAVLLLVLVILLVALQVLSAPRYSREVVLTTLPFLCLGMPGLFACGVGALLVGYEKELRTLGWLSSLPIPSRWIVRVKVLAGLAGLLALWGIGMGILAILSASGSAPPATASANTWIVPLGFTVYLLLAGFALAWWTRSALVSLLLIVPAGSLPFVVAYVIDAWVRQIPSQQIPTTATGVACLAVSIPLAWWLSERLGSRALGARSNRPSWPARVLAWQRDETWVQRYTTRPILSPLPALTWQFFQQSRAVLLVTSTLLALATCATATCDVANGQGGVFGLAVFVAFLATSWLGVTTFQSDTLYDRSRFLAERGISAASAWVTRQIVPFSLVALACLILMVMSVTTAWRNGRDLDVVVSPIFAYVFLAIVVYLFSQWLSQVFFSPILAGVAAPLVALAAISYGVFAVESLGTPLWLIIALVALPIPPIATWVMTRRWMDRRLGFSYWAIHFAFLSVCVLVPVVPLVVHVATQPTMPDRMIREIERVARDARGAPLGPLELVVDQPDTSPRSEEQPDSGAIAVLDDIERQLDATDQPVGSSSFRVIENLRSIAELARLSLDATAGSALDSNESRALGEGERAGFTADASLQVYRRAIELLVRITQRMRLSPRVIDQDTADLIEIWLLTELLRDPAEARMESALFQRAASMLADRESRRESRLRAIALSWDAFQSASHNALPDSLGGYSLPLDLRSRGTPWQNWLDKKRVGLAAADLWELAGNRMDAAHEDRLARIAEFWGHPTSAYGLGPLGPYSRADDLDQFLHPLLNTHMRRIASQWRADWERIAAERWLEQESSER